MLGKKSLKTFHHLARAIFIKDKKVLLAQAAGYTNTFLPGGHIEFGESAKDVLIREIEEELGIASTMVDFQSFTNNSFGTSVVP